MNCCDILFTNLGTHELAVWLSKAPSKDWQDNFSHSQFQMEKITYGNIATSVIYSWNIHNNFSFWITNLLIFCLFHSIELLTCLYRLTTLIDLVMDQADQFYPEWWTPVVLCMNSSKKKCLPSLQDQVWYYESQWGTYFSRIPLTFE